MKKSYLKQLRSSYEQYISFYTELHHNNKIYIQITELPPNGQTAYKTCLGQLSFSFFQLKLKLFQQSFISLLISFYWQCNVFYHICQVYHEVLCFFYYVHIENSFKSFPARDCLSISLGDSPYFSLFTLFIFRAEFCIYFSGGNYQFLHV